MNKIFRLLLLISLVAISCKADKKENVEKPKTVKVYRIASETNYSNLAITGVIKEKKSVNLAFRIAGPIHKLPVEIGTFVKKNSLIAEIDPRDYKLKYNVTKAEYDQVIAEVERVEELFKRKSVAQNDYDKAVSGKQRISIKMEAAKNSLNDTKLIAPFDGYIQEKYFENYETVDAGMPVVSLIDLRTLIVESEVSASLYLQKELFSSFKCIPTDMKNEEFEIKLIESSKKSNNNQLYTLRFELKNNSSKRLFPGMNVDVLIKKQNKDSEYIKIPNSCIFHKNQKNFVWLVKDNKLVQKEVQIGRININSYTEVSGLSESDIIVSAGVNRLKNNQKVKILKQASKTNVGGML